MAIGPSLGELTGLIHDASPTQYRDFGLNEHEQERQKLLMHRAQLGDQRAQMELNAIARAREEQGRNQRAQQGLTFDREKFGFEQQKFGAEAGQKRQAQLEQAYAQLRDAQDRGDAAGVDYARQAIQRLGETVEGAGPSPQSAPVPGSTAAQPPPPPAPAGQGSPLSVLSGMPRPRPARVGLPPSEAHPSPPAGMQLEEGPQQPFQPFVKGGNGVELQEAQGPAGGPPPALPQAASHSAPEAGGAVTSGLARLGGRIPPPGGPPQESSTQGAQAAGFSKELPPKPAPDGGLAALGAQYYPKPLVPPAKVALEESSAPPPQAAPEAPQAAPGGGLKVLRGGAPVLQLGGADAPNQVKSTLQSLLTNARTPEEKRSAQIAIDVAMGAVQRQGVEKAVDIGLKAYEREQNNNRKTRIGTGKGVGEAGFGGSGFTKDEIAVDTKDAERYDKVIQRTAQQYGINSEVMRADSALASVEAAMNSNTGTGQLAAVTKALKAMGNTGAMSDRDLNRIMESSGIWNSFKNILARAESGTLPPELMSNLKGMTGQLRGLIRQKRQEAGEAARDGVMNDPFIYGDRDRAAEAAFGAFAGYGGKKPAPRAQKKPGAPGQQKPTAAPAGQPKTIDELL